MDDAILGEVGFSGCGTRGGKVKGRESLIFWDEGENCLSFGAAVLEAIEGDTDV